MKDCLMRCQSTDSVQRQSIFPKTNSPFLARDRATHTRFSVFKKPMRFSALLRTRERRMISFSSPWKLSTTVTSRSGEISNRFCSLNEYLLVKFNAQYKTKYYFPLKQIYQRFFWFLTLNTLWVLVILGVFKTM